MTKKAYTYTPFDHNDEFMKWCESFKPCRYCEQLFVGPVCPCETPFSPRVPLKNGNDDA